MGRQTKNGIALGVAGFVAPLALYWLGGGDFERSLGLAGAAYCSLALCGIGVMAARAFHE